MLIINLVFKIICIEFFKNESIKFIEGIRD